MKHEEYKHTNAQNIAMLCVLHAILGIFIRIKYNADQQNLYHYISYYDSDSLATKRFYFKLLTDVMKIIWRKSISLLDNRFVNRLILLQNCATYTIFIIANRVSSIPRAGTV